jgi:hypothetical protein
MKYRIQTENGSQVMRSRQAVAEWVELNFQEYKRVFIEKITGDGFVKETSDLTEVAGKSKI